MNKVFALCCLLCLAWPAMQGQSLQLIHAKIDLPEGPVDGAAFYEEQGKFFIEQDIHNGTRQSELSSWDIASHTQIAKKNLDDPQTNEVSHCGRVQVSKTLHRVYVCGQNHNLQGRDADTLETVSTIAHVDGQRILDFALDDARGRVAVLAYKEKLVRLTLYSLATGEALAQTTVPDDPRGAGEYLGRDRVAVSPSGEIGISLDDKNGGPLRVYSGLYLCSDAPHLACSSASIDERSVWVGEIAFLGNDLLAVSSKPIVAAEIFSVSPGFKYSLKKPWEFGASQKYFKWHGVRYAVGVVQQKYVVGFTGADAPDVWHKDYTYKSASTSFSVWRVGSSRVVATDNLPKEPRWQMGFSIVGSTTQPLFLAYNIFANTLYLYTITER